MWPGDPIYGSLGINVLGPVLLVLVSVDGGEILVWRHGVCLADVKELSRCRGWWELSIVHNCYLTAVARPRTVTEAQGCGASKDNLAKI